MPGTTVMGISEDNVFINQDSNIIKDSTKLIEYEKAVANGFTGTIEEYL